MKVKAIQSENPGPPVPQSQKKMTISVDIEVTEKFRELLDKLKALTEQIEINNYKDSLGHELKMNEAYINFKKFLK